MLRAVFIGIFLSVYILIAGPPLLVYTLISRNPDPLYWAGIRGVMFFVRAVGVRVRVRGLERIPPGVCLFAANHTSSADAPAVVGAIPRRIAILLKASLFKWPIAGQAFGIHGSNHQQAVQIVFGEKTKGRAPSFRYTQIQAGKRQDLLIRKRVSARDVFPEKFLKWGAGNFVDGS